MSDTILAIKRADQRTGFLNFVRDWHDRGLWTVKAGPKAGIELLGSDKEIGETMRDERKEREFRFEEAARIVADRWEWVEWETMR